MTSHDNRDLGPSDRAAGPAQPKLTKRDALLDGGHHPERAAHLRLLPQPSGRSSTTARTLTSINGHRDEPRHLPRYLTVAEVAGMLRESRATVYRLVHAGQLPGLRVGRSVRVSRNAAQRYLRDAAPGDSQT